MAFNELIVLPSLLKKLKQAGYQNMQQLIARKSTELKAGTREKTENSKRSIY